MVVKKLFEKLVVVEGSQGGCAAISKNQHSDSMRERGRTVSLEIPEIVTSRKTVIEVW